MAALQGRSPRVMAALGAATHDFLCNHNRTLFPLTVKALQPALDCQTSCARRYASTTQGKMTVTDTACPATYKAC
jgi:hypothetical protein